MKNRSDNLEEYLKHKKARDEFSEIDSYDFLDYLRDKIYTEKTFEYRINKLLKAYENYNDIPKNMKFLADIRDYIREWNKLHKDEEMYIQLSVVWQMIQSIDIDGIKYVEGMTTPSLITIKNKSKIIITSKTEDSWYFRTGSDTYGAGIGNKLMINIDEKDFDPDTDGTEQLYVNNYVGQGYYVTADGPILSKLCTSVCSVMVL